MLISGCNGVSLQCFLCGCVSVYTTPFSFISWIFLALPQSVFVLLSVSNIIHMKDFKVHSEGKLMARSKFQQLLYVTRNGSKTSHIHFFKWFFSIFSHFLLWPNNLFPCLYLKAHISLLHAVAPGSISEAQEYSTTKCFDNWLCLFKICHELWLSLLQACLQKRR